LSAARLGIAGVGLIGGSIALRARASQIPVIGYDRDPATLERALARGSIDATSPDLAALARRCDTLVIALPVDATREALGALAGSPGPALVIDVASVKASLVEPGSHVANYVGTHPMAGREQGGFGFADPELFANATWAHSPDPDAALIAKTRAFIAAMGAIPLEIDPERHDAIVALTSHLPQALSVVLGAELAAAARADRRVTELCGPGMMTMLRLARSPESIWAPIVAANAGPIAARLRSLVRALDACADALESGESAQLMSHFARAREAVDNLEERFSPSSRS
jgi:prephenate dehydrogenase